MLRQEAAYIASAMPIASFLASKKIPLIKSDNCRGGPTPAKEKKPPTEINLPALRGVGAARRIRPPLRLPRDTRGIGKFITVGQSYDAQLGTQAL